MSTTFSLKSLLFARKAENEDHEVNETQAITSQVTLALLIVFMLASAIIQSNYEGKIKNLEDANEEAKVAIDYFKGQTNQGLRDQAAINLMEIQRQKLLRELEKMQLSFEKDLWLDVFVKKGEDNAIPSIMEGTKLTDGSFVRACKFARDNLQDESSLLEDWLLNIISAAELKVEIGGTIVDATDRIQVNPEYITTDNLIWIQDATKKTITSLFERTRLMHSSVVLQLRNYFFHNSEMLQGQPCFQTIQMYIAANVDGQDSLLRQFSFEMDSYLENLLASQDVYLLGKTWDQARAY